MKKVGGGRGREGGREGGREEARMTMANPKEEEEENV